MIKVGFTGTQKGMTEHQKTELIELLEEFPTGTEFHHGDCVGADRQANDIAFTYRLILVIHPPSKNTKRAFCMGHRSEPPKPYLVRNKNIVSECDILIAAPGEYQEQKRSGTWYTIRKAKEAHKDIRILYP